MGFMNDLAAKYSLEVRKGQAWGFIDGYWFQLEPPAYGKALLRIRTAVRLPEGDAAGPVIEELAQIVNGNSITCNRENGSITLDWIQPPLGFKTDAVDGMLTRLVSVFRRAGAEPACFACNEAETGGFAVVNGSAMRLCSSCMANIEHEIEAENQAYQESKGNFGLGLLGALIGALVGSIAWVGIGLLGYLAAIGGFAISFCAIKGYQLMKGKITKLAIVLICLICLAVMVLAQFLTLDLQLYIELQKAGEQVAFGDVLAFMFELPFSDPELTSGFLGDCGLGLLFMGIGSFSVFKQLFTSAKAPGGKLERV